MSRTRDFQPSHSSSARGFSLVELMIVVVILAILLTVALPGYQNSVQKGRRADAKSALVDAANRQEGYMLDKGTYSLELTDLGFAQSPYISEEGHYSVQVAVCSGGSIARCYVLTATPRLGSPQEDDERCTTFILHSNGSKTATGSDPLNCW
ncbi:MAG: type IV pilin protein [Halioglobus sp.]|nr:type IV pilin protein [Halioglobus sp.]